MKLLIKIILLTLCLTAISLLPAEISTFLQNLVLMIFLLILIIFVVTAFELHLLELPATLKRKRPEEIADPPKFRRVSYDGIQVCYTLGLNGGGLGLSYEYVRLVKEQIGKVGHVYEYCAGPGFIGFNLLANNLCDRLTLSDVNPEAIEAEEFESQFLSQ